MKKNIFAVTLAFMLILSLFPLSASAELVEVASYSTNWGWECQDAAGYGGFGATPANGWELIEGKLGFGRMNGSDQQNWGLVSNWNTGSSSHGDGMLIYNTKSWSAPMSYAIKVTHWSGNLGNDARVLFNFQDKDNYYYFSIGNDRQTLCVGKVIAGGEPIILDSTVTSAYDWGGGRNVVITLDENSNISVSVDGNPLFTNVTDSNLSFTSGKIGIAVLKATNFGYTGMVSFESIKVTQLKVKKDYLGVYTEDFSDSARVSENWKNYRSNAALTLDNGQMKGVWGDIALFILDTETLGKNYVYSVDVAPTANSTGNVSLVVFNYSKVGDNENFYAVALEGGDTTAKDPRIKLIKSTKTTSGTTGAGTETVLATSDNTYISLWSPVRIDVLYETNGNITVYATKSGVKTRLFSINDTSFGPGKIGIGTKSDETKFDNVYIEEEPFELIQKDVKQNGNYVNLAKLSDQKGKELDIEIKLINNSPVAIPEGQLIAILVDENGKIKSSGVSGAFTLPAYNISNPSAEANAKITVPATAEDSWTIRLYFWDGIDSMQPIVDSYRTLK